MIHKSYTIRFVLHRRSDTARQYLQMRVTPRGGKPVSFTTGVSLTPGEWDATIGRAKGRTEESAEANTLIAQWSQLVANVFSHYDKLNIVPTAEQLRGAFARATEEDNAVSGYVPQELSRVTLQAALTQFTLDKKNRSSWSQGTVVALQSFRRMVGDFMPNTIVNDIDIPWMEKFHEWMVKERNQQGVSVNGNLVKMRWFLRWARRKGYYKGEADREYRPKVKGADIKSRAIVYLTREELRKLEAYEFEEPHFNVAKDVFLFCCYTGLRSSDIIKLTRADCYNDYITFTTQKTGHTLTIPLNERAKAILDRYAKCKPNRKQKADGITNPALPTTALKTSNKHLHVMLKRVGIDAPTHHVYYIGSERFDETKPKYELVTTHTARHTFIVTAISLGIPIPVIMEWTGHSNFKNMQPYIAIANDTSVQAMQRFNNL